ncbi:MAG TPA: HtaA domain-containing protein [Iamia sp.]|nr:HtaA domain-containing protein [Iamia sp.]
MTTGVLDGRRRSVPQVLATVVVAVATVVAGAAAPAAAQEPPPPVAITEAPPLDWEFKASWRDYAGAPEASGGAEVVTTPDGRYDLAWAFDSGTYDAATGTTVVQYRGTVHWTKYPLRDFPSFVPPGYTGSLDVPILDVTLTDPVVTISRDRADIVVDAIGRDRDTMALETFPGSAVADLDVATVVPDVTATTTTWTDIVATSGPGADDAFDGTYPRGTVIDAVSFSYTGPGGAPDFSDLFTEPGTITLEEVGNEILTTNGNDEMFRMWWYDETRRIAHWRHQDVETGAQVFRAFSLDAMAWVGQPWVPASGDPATPSTVRFTDPVSGRAYFGSGANIRWVGFDTATGTYQAGTLAQPFPNVSNNYSWDPVGDRAMSIRRVVPPGVGSSDFDGHVWTVATFTETTPGVWTRRDHALPRFPTGLNAAGYATSSTGSEATMAALPDGSLVVLGVRQTSSNPDVPAPTTYAAAHRIVLDGQGGGTTQPIAGTELASGDAPYSRILSGPDGQLTLVMATGGRVRTQGLTWDAGTGAVTAGPVVEVANVVTSPGHAAIDPVDGTVWVGDEHGRRLVGIDDGRIVADQYVPNRHPRGGWIFVSPDSTVYAQTNDGSPAQFGGSPIVGIGEYRRLGYSPTITGDPADVVVTLGVGEASEDVAFTAAATGTPAPEPQWQVRAPGSARFVDVAGATAATLTVTARPGMDGSEYRAVFENAAGRVATEPAVLAVDHAPIVTFQPPDVAVVAGADATFDLIATAMPEAEVTWQRYAAGFWWNIGPDDDGLVLSGTGLTVAATNGDQDGTRFRARVRNAVGTVHTRVATLSVTEPADEPQHVVGGDLDWGVRQSFRTYITGPIAHGAIATTDGATVDTDGTFLFPAAGGTVDGEAVDAAFAGTVRFTGHDGAGTPAGVPALDVRLSDVRVAIDGQDGTLVADVVSRGLEDGALTTYDDLAVADLDLAGITPTPVGDGLRWSAVPATLTEGGVPAFADFYPAGSALDPLTITLALSDEAPTPDRTAVESFATAALTDLLGDAPSDGEIAAAVTAVERTGKARFLRTLTTSDPWLAAIVDDLYAETLGRPASAADRAFWVGRLHAGWSVARVAASIHAAREHHVGTGGTDAAWVADLYRSLLGRAGTPREIAWWVGETAARGRGNVALRFYQTPESGRARVAALYAHLLGRTASRPDLDFWAVQVVRRGDLALAVSLAASPEYQARAERRFP